MFRYGLATLWISFFFLPACSGSPAFVEQPEVVPNPNSRAPLVALIRFAATGAIRTSVDVDDGDRQWRIDFPKVATPSDPLVVLGMRPGREHSFIVTVYDDLGNSQTAEPLTFATHAVTRGQVFDAALSGESVRA